jgi:hypothetical protein
MQQNARCNAQNSCIYGPNSLEKKQGIQFHQTRNYHNRAIFGQFVSFSMSTEDGPSCTWRGHLRQANRAAENGPIADSRLRGDLAS